MYLFLFLFDGRIPNSYNLTERANCYEKKHRLFIYGLTYHQKMAAYTRLY